MQAPVPEDTFECMYVHIGGGVDWRWSGLENKMKWIGLEWRKGREIGEQSCPKTHFLTKTHKTPFPTK